MPRNVVILFDDERPIIRTQHGITLGDLAIKVAKFIKLETDRFYRAYDCNGEEIGNGTIRTRAITEYF